MNKDRFAKEHLEVTLNQIRNLLKHDAGWNGYDSLAPNYDAVVHAENWISRLFLEVAELDRFWIKPNYCLFCDQYNYTDSAIRMK